MSIKLASEMRVDSLPASVFQVITSSRPLLDNLTSLIIPSLIKSRVEILEISPVFLLVSLISLAALS
jgi:hypothetical protein